MRVFEECPECGEVLEIIIEVGIRGDPDRAYVEEESQVCGCEIEPEWAGEVLSGLDLEDLWASEMGLI